jgi:hypothetical protein
VNPAADLGAARRCIGFTQVPFNDGLFAGRISGAQKARTRDERNTAVERVSANLNNRITIRKDKYVRAADSG